MSLQRFLDHASLVLGNGMGFLHKGGFGMKHVGKALMLSFVGGFSSHAMQQTKQHDASVQAPSLYGHLYDEVVQQKVTPEQTAAVTLPVRYEPKEITPLLVKKLVVQKKKPTELEVVRQQNKVRRQQEQHVLENDARMLGGIGCVWGAWIGIVAAFLLL